MTAKKLQEAFDEIYEYIAEEFGADWWDSIDLQMVETELRLGDTLKEVKGYVRKAVEDDIAKADVAEILGW